MSKPDKDLFLSAYRMAGFLLMSEKLGGGGWALVWHNEKTGRYPAAGYFQHQDGGQKSQTLAGYLAEAIASEELIDVESAELDKALESALALMEKETGVSVGRAESRYVLKVVCSRWFQIRGYARYVLKQWENPAMLRRFELSKDPEAPAAKERPAHHKPAYEPGVITPAALIQSADPRYGIPDVMRAGPRHPEAPAPTPETTIRVEESR